MKNSIYILILLLLSLLNSCNIIFPISTNTKLKNADSSARIYLSKEGHKSELLNIYDSTGNDVVKLTNKNRFYLLTQKKDKHINNYSVIYPTKFNKLKLLDFGIQTSMFAAFFLLNENGVIPGGDEELAVISSYSIGAVLATLFYPKRVYKKEITLDTFVPYPVKSEELKYIYISKVGFNVLDGNYKIYYYKNYDKYKNSVEEINQTTVNSSIEFDDSEFSFALDDFLTDCGFTDSSSVIYSNSTNSCLLEANILKIEHNIVYNKIINTKFKIEWKLKDYYSREEYAKFITEEKSGFLPLQSIYFYDSYLNCIQLSMNKLLQNPEFRNNIKTEEEEEEEIIPVLDIYITNKETQTISSVLQSFVEVKTGKNTGSGVIISHDGYILTSFQNTGKNDTVSIKLTNGKLLDGLVVRKNSKFGISLIKIESSNLNSINTILTSSPVAGEEVYSFGVPEIEEAGPIFTKGIISGFRKNKEFTFIQTDVKITGSHSGAPLINLSDGRLIGIINTKMEGFGVEGLGFAVPIGKIEEILNIRFKQ